MRDLSSLRVGAQLWNHRSSGHPTMQMVFEFDFQTSSTTGLPQDSAHVNVVLWVIKTRSPFDNEAGPVPSGGSEGEPSSRASGAPHRWRELAPGILRSTSSHR